MFSAKQRGVAFSKRHYVFVVNDGHEAPILPHPAAVSGSFAARQLLLGLFEVIANHQWKMADRTDVVNLIWRQALVAGGALNVSDEIHQFTLKVVRNAEDEREH